MNRPPRAVKSRPAPLSIRLSDDERRRLEALAAGRPVSAYVKSVLFGAGVSPRRAFRQASDPKSLAALLARLGQSGLADSLKVLARQAEAGTLYADATLHARLLAACDDVRAMRAMLMQGLGKEVPPPVQSLSRLSGIGGWS